MEALVPMVDLFAVLAIVFMIHSNEEITITQEVRQRLEAIDEAEQARRERRELLAQEASKSLEEIRAERERKAQELLAQFTEMLAAQQSDAATEYEVILARIEAERDEELRMEVSSLEEEKQAELEQTRAELELALEMRKSELLEEHERLSAQLQKEKELALAQADQERLDELAKQEAELDRRRQLEVAQIQRDLNEQAEREAAQLRKENELALAQAYQEQFDALAKQEAELDKQRQLEVARTEQELRRQAEGEAAELRRENELALAQAYQEHKGDLAAQKSALEREKAQALSENEQAFTDKLEQQKNLLAEVAGELAPYVQALEAKKEIIGELDENFKDFDTSAVEIDEKTGRVKLHFQESYFALGSYKLSEDMKSFLRIMIPRYAKGIYGNKDAAAQVESLKISGMASPIFRGVYIDINDNSPETERARKYNMELSNNRAKALYDFIFDEDEMGDYEFRSRLEADMSIAALGFQNATPVQDELVGKPAMCIEYDCKQEQATILQFQLFTEE